MRGQMTHLDTDVLAEFRAGLITGRRGTRIAVHLAGCDRCTALDDRLAGVSALLASVPAPAMPDRVAQRLDTVLAAEVARRDYPERAQGDSSRESGTRDRPAANRGFRLLSLRVLAPVAVVLLAAGGYGVSRMISPGNPPAISSAGSAPASSAARQQRRLARQCREVGRWRPRARSGTAPGVDGYLARRDQPDQLLILTRHAQASGRDRAGRPGHVAHDPTRILARARVRAADGRRLRAGPGRERSLRGPARDPHRRPHGPGRHGLDSGS